MRINIQAVSGDMTRVTNMIVSRYECASCTSAQRKETAAVLVHSVLKHFTISYAAALLLPVLLTAAAA
jgi:hypothetical protein